MPVALITGAARGIGLEVGRQLAADHDVILTARDRSAGSAAAAEVGARFEVLDVTDPSACAALAAATPELDVLVANAAAFVDWGEVASAADLAAAREVLDVNLFGTWRVVQAFLPHLRRSDHPRIVVVASGAGSHGDPDYGLGARGGRAASYGISKAAVLALVTTLAAELADTPVLVNAVDPGLTATFPGAADMGARPVGAGAAGIAWAARLPDDGPTGGFFRDGEPHPW
jgi:NAD(P)-dependent dehydrogenase (short-subunit alcohol dehydrogenase family)